MLSSVQCGLRYVAEVSEGVLICPGDQPMADKEIINLVISAFKSSEKGIVIPTCENKRGHPVMINNKYYDEIMNFRQGNTLRKIIENHPADIEEVETGSSSVLKDIDTPDDYMNELKLIS
jgi:molybdenum cofactor cytidylyltransferase